MREAPSMTCFRTASLASRGPPTSAAAPSGAQPDATG